MAFRLFRSLLVLSALAGVPEAQAGDPFGAAPDGPRPSAPRPLPQAPIAEIAPYLNSHPSSAGLEFRSGPSSIDDYRYLRTAPPTPEIAFYRLVVRKPASLDVFEEPLAPMPPLTSEVCSSAWFTDSACVLRLYTGEGRR